jgi:hypothetical protein
MPKSVHSESCFGIKAGGLVKRWEIKKCGYDLLLFPLLAYAMANLLHHVHNAVFLVDYPNMPV